MDQNSGISTLATNPHALNRSERLVVWILRLIGVLLISALIPVFFPKTLMADLHDQFGLGSFPDQPISWYFARSLSLMYFAHGVLVFSLSFDVQRYWPLLRVLVFLNFVLGAVLTGIDIACQMPWWWTAMEGPSIILGGMVLLVLIKRSEQ